MNAKTMEMTLCLSEAETAHFAMELELLVNSKYQGDGSDERYVRECPIIASIAEMGLATYTDVMKTKFEINTSDLSGLRSVLKQMVDDMIKRREPPPGFDGTA